MNLILQEQYSFTKMQLVNLTNRQNQPIIMIGDDFVLYKNNKVVDSVFATPDAFTNLKLVSHVALATYVML